MSEGSDRLAADLKVETLAGPVRVLADEAVRIKARLDSLDGWIRGTHKSWFVLGDLLDGEVSLVINAPLGEARQQALALRQILETIAKLTAGEAPAPVANPLDEMAKRRAERIAGKPTSAIVEA